jgi:hypothetical protein
LYFYPHFLAELLGPFDAKIIPELLGPFDAKIIPYLPANVVSYFQG